MMSDNTNPLSSNTNNANAPVFFPCPFCSQRYKTDKLSEHIERCLTNSTESPLNDSMILKEINKIKENKKQKRLKKTETPDPNEFSKKDFSSIKFVDPSDCKKFMWQRQFQRKTTIRDIPFCPIYRPTAEEFKDTLEYIKKITPEARKYGICKIIPPKEKGAWLESGYLSRELVSPENIVFSTKLQNIHQLMVRKGPNVRFVRSLEKFLDKCGMFNSETESLQRPTFKGQEIDLYILFKTVRERGGFQVVDKKDLWEEVVSDNKLGSEIETYKACKLLRDAYIEFLFHYEIHLDKHLQKQASSHSPSSSKTNLKVDKDDDEHDMKDDHHHSDQKKTKNQIDDEHKLGDLNKQEMMDDDVDDEDVDEENPKITNKINSNKNTNKIDHLNTEMHHINRDDQLDKKRDVHDIDNESSEKDDKRSEENASEPSEADNEPFGYGTGKNLNLLEIREISKEFEKTYFKGQHTTIEEKEEAFWKIIEDAQEAIEVFYGSDVPKVSAFPTDPNDPASKSGWNLTVLPRLPQSILRFTNEEIPGVTDPMMYIGMLFSAFCWHMEDNFLASISYNHSGETKVWYGAPGGSSSKMEQVSRKLLPELWKDNPLLMHQLVTMVDPVDLMEEGVPIYKSHHGPGEFMITFPKAFHAGFNCGFNIAEAVNFALTDWVPYGRESIEMYQTLQRPTAFPHEELILNASNSFPTKESIHFLLPELRLLIDKEKQKRDRIKEHGIVYCVPCAQKQEVKQCIVCKSDCFFSGVMCACSPTRITCLNHFEKLCSCDSASKYLTMRYTLSYLKSVEMNLENRLELFESTKNAKSNQAKSNKRKLSETNSKEKISKNKISKLAKTGGLKDNYSLGINPIASTDFYKVRGKVSFINKK